MGIYEHLTEFAGKPVRDWEREVGIQDAAGTIYRVSLSWEEMQAGRRGTGLVGTVLGFFGLGRKRDGEAEARPVPGVLDRFLEDPAVSRISGLVIGAWGEIAEGSGPVVEALVAARDRLPHLQAIFLGDITAEESEISWIEQGDVSPLLDAYPQLEHFAVRGGNSLSLGTLRHERLRSLVVQSGGLPASVVREVGAAQLPALEHLELWLGTEDYGGKATVEDLAPILSGELFSRLTYLGLRDSEIADPIAAAVATAPVTERLRVLDLSLGTLGDEGAAALLASPAVARLQKLDIHHHYCSEEMVARLQALPMEVDASERQDPEEDDGERYVAVGE